MKKLLFLILTIPGLLMAFCFSSCKDKNDDDVVVSAQETYLQFELPFDTVLKGEIIPLTATVMIDGTKETADAVIEYATSNASVASIENGKVTALAKGECTITATCKYGKKTYEQVCTLNVIEEKVAIHFSNLENDMDLFGGRSIELTATVTVNDVLVENPTLVWQTSNEKIATVSGNVLTAVSEGRVVITVTYLEYSHSVTVVVVAP